MFGLQNYQMWAIIAFIILAVIFFVPKLFMIVFALALLGFAVWVISNWDRFKNDS